MSNCCMRRPAKFHVDSSVRFWVIANIREGGGASNAPPGQARVNICIMRAVLKHTQVVLVFLQLRHMFVCETLNISFQHGMNGTHFKH